MRVSITPRVRDWNYLESNKDLNNNDIYVDGVAARRFQRLQTALLGLYSDTLLRQQVFEEIAATHASIGAYEILARLGEKGTRVAPISIYRAIDALLDAGVIHRLESKNAFFACRRTDHTVKGRRPIFLSCEKCGAVGEVDGQHIFDLIGEAAKEAKFTPRIKFVEVQGLCPRCTTAAEKA